MTEFPHDVLSGESPGLQKARRFARMLSPPRGKLRSAPLAGPFRPILHLFGFNRWALNEQLCRNCMQTMDGGGAEIDVSVLYADSAVGIKGSGIRLTTARRSCLAENPSIRFVGT